MTINDLIAELQQEDGSLHVHLSVETECGTVFTAKSLDFIDTSDSTCCLYATDEIP